MLLIHTNLITTDKIWMGRKEKARGKTRDSMKSQQLLDHPDLRSTLIGVMVLSLTCWKETTGKTEIELAEESQLWKVYKGQGSLKT